VGQANEYSESMNDHVDLVGETLELDQSSSSIIIRISFPAPQADKMQLHGCQSPSLFVRCGFSIELLVTEARRIRELFTTRKVSA